MTRCEACGSQLPDGAEFCPVCAAPVPERPSAAPVQAPGGPAPAAAPRPDRAASAAEAEPELAGIGRRLAAFVIDQVVVALPAFVILATQLGSLDLTQPAQDLRPYLLANGLSLVGAAGMWVAESLTGRTVGNALLGTRTVDETTLQPAGLARVFVRLLVQGAGSLACFVGVYVVVVSGRWDAAERRQGWHDKAAKTLVLRTPSASAAGRAGPAAHAAPASSVARSPHAAPARQAAPAPPPYPSSAPVPTAAPAPAPAPARARGTSSAPGESGPLIAAVPGFSRPADPSVPPEGSPPPHASSPASAPPATSEPPPAPAAPAPLTEVAVPAAGVSAGSPARPADDDVDSTRLVSPAARGPITLVLPGGERLTVEGDGVLGRNPATPVGTEVVHLVPVGDPTRSVSKTHLGFGLDAVGLWVEDLHSTNGTAVVSPDGTRTPLTPGLAVHVAPGDVVIVGDVRVEVSR